MHKSEQRGHVAAVPRPSDAVFLCFPLSPSGQKLCYYRTHYSMSLRKQRALGGLQGTGVQRGLVGGSAEPWDGGLSTGAPWQVCPTGLPRPWQSPTRKGQEAEPQPGTREPHGERSVRRGRDQET